METTTTRSKKDCTFFEIRKIVFNAIFLIDKHDGLMMYLFCLLKDVKKLV